MHTLIASIAYSTWNRRPSGLNVFTPLSYSLRVRNIFLIQLLPAAVDCYLQTDETKDDLEAELWVDLQQRGCDAELDDERHLSRNLSDSDLPGVC
jgi:hypothetical protein